MSVPVGTDHPPQRSLLRAHPVTRPEQLAHRAISALVTAVPFTYPGVGEAHLTPAATALHKPLAAAAARGVLSDVTALLVRRPAELGIAGVRLAAPRLTRDGESRRGDIDICVQKIMDGLRRLSSHEVLLVLGLRRSPYGHFFPLPSGEIYDGKGPIPEAVWKQVGPSLGQLAANPMQWWWQNLPGQPYEWALEGWLDGPDDIAGTLQRWHALCRRPTLRWTG